MACRQAKPGSRFRRQGAVLAVVVVCLMVITVVLLSIVKMAASGRRLIDGEAQQVQAAWLAESGLERAAAQLAADADYPGETWTLPAEEFSGSQAAVVKIEVEAVPERPDRRLVRVRADYPDHPQHRARHSKQALVQVSTGRQQEPSGEEP